MAAERAVRVVAVEAQVTAVIAALTDWDAFGALWPALLSEVWEALRAAGAASGRNVMLYKDARPAVEVGAELLGPFEPRGRVTRSSLPSGRAATITDPGPPTPQSLRAAHHAIAEFCNAEGLTRSGPRWEIYSHWSEVPDENHTDVYHLLV